MKNAITAAVLFVAALAVWFVSRSGEATPKPAPTPVVVCERWQDTLAARIGKSITMADELSSVLVEMYSAGDITNEELTAVQAALPDLTLKNRSLTSADADKIRGVK